MTDYESQFGGDCDHPNSMLNEHQGTDEIGVYTRVQCMGCGLVLQEEYHRGW